MTFQERMEQARQQSGNVLNIIQAGVMPSTESVQQIPLELLHEFSNHTFRVREDAPDYLALKDSITENGIKSPLLVRRHSQIPGEYEIIAGHRRLRIARQLGMATVPCLVSVLSDEDATEQMIETNIQRPDWLPSEKAQSYKAHLDAVKNRTGITERQRTDLTAGNSCPQLRNRDITAARMGISAKQLEMYVKLNDLLPGLLDMTDNGRIAAVAAYQIAFLPADQQQIVLDFLLQHSKIIKGERGKDLRQAGEANELNEAYMLRLFGLQKGNAGTAKRQATEAQIKISFSSDVLLNKKTVKAALNDAALLERIESLIADYARENNMPLD